MFKTDDNGKITRVSDSKVIPKDITNVDYQNYLYVLANRVDPTTHLPAFPVSTYLSK